MSDEADNEDNVEATDIDQVMHHKHPVVQLVREQIKNVGDPSIDGENGADADGTDADGTVATSKSATSGGRGRSSPDDSASGGEGGIRRSSMGSRVWEKRGYCASSMMLLVLIWLVLIYGAFIGANLCGSLSFKHKLCSGCGIGLGVLPGYSETEHIYTRGVF